MRNSVMAHNFAQIEQHKIPRTRFDRSSRLITAFDGGKLVPIYADLIVPGDTLQIDPSLFARLATPESPFMTDLYLDVFSFFVPFRLVWSNFKKMMGEQDNPGDSIDYTVPVLDDGDTTFVGGTDFANETLHDYFGLPTKTTNFIDDISALWFRAYYLIWNEWFRDQNLQNSLTVTTGDGPDQWDDYTLQYRGKRHDMFTAAATAPQKGDAVLLPLGTSAPLVGTLDVVTDGTAPTFKLNAAGSHNLQRISGTDVDWTGSPATGTATWDDPHLQGDLTSHTVDLSSAVGPSVNQMRQAVQVQKLYELSMVGGTRYTEQMRTQFGVISPDARLQRPEYLGGVSKRIDIQPVAQTSETNTTNLATLSGVGTAMISDRDQGGFIKSFTEHGAIIMLACVRGDEIYQEGLDRMWSYNDRLDFYTPLLAHLGEQSILNKEIYADGSANDDGVFGYTGRFDEMRYRQNRVTGKMRSNDAASLDNWHGAREFGTLPSLNAAFIKDDPTYIDRMIATPAEPHIILDAYFETKHTRPMPVFSTPGRMDHF